MASGMSLFVIGIDPGSERSAVARFIVSLNSESPCRYSLDSMSMFDNGDYMDIISRIGIGDTRYQFVIERPRTFQATLPQSSQLHWVAGRFFGAVETRIGLSRVVGVYENSVRAWLCPTKDRPYSGKLSKSNVKLRVKLTDDDRIKAVVRELGRDPFTGKPADDNHLADACAAALWWIISGRHKNGTQ